MWYSKAGKHLVDEDIIAEESDGLGEDWVVMVEGRGDDPLVEDGVSQDVDQENFSLSDGETEEMDGNFIGGGVQD